MSEIGRWNGVDPLSDKAYELTPYRFCANNPIRFNDNNGKYETDGHYWTIYLVCLKLGMDRSQAEKLAKFAELPDTKISKGGNYYSIQTTWADSDHAKPTHALTGLTSKYEIWNTSVQLLNVDINNLQEIGRLLHRFGDSFAHSKMDGSGNMYGHDFNVLGEDISSVNEGHLDEMEADQISARPGLYTSYVDQIAELISVKFGLDMSKFDRNYFHNLAVYANENNISLIGILNSEVSRMTNSKQFNITFARYQGSRLGKFALQSRSNHNNHVFNTMAFLNANGIKYTTEDCYDDEGNYSGTRFIIK